VVTVARISKGMLCLGRVVVIGWLFVVMTIFAPSVYAENTDVRYDFHIEEKTLGGALGELVRETNVLVLYPYELAQTTGVNPIIGQHTVTEALEILLRGTKFSGGLTESGVLTISLNEAKKPQGREENVSILNTKKTKRSLLASISALLFGASGAMGANAQDANNDNEFVLDEIIVTASRRSESLQNVASAISAVNPDDYIIKGLTSISDIIDYTPGINFKSGGAPGFGSITIRGASQESSTPIVGIYVDDVPFTTNSPFSGGVSVLYDGLLSDIERVELVKGPQGTLYGAGAVGGVIKYITKDPALEEFRADALVDVSTTKGGEISQLYKATVSSPIVKDKVGLTLSGFYDDQGGYVDRIDSPITTAQEDVNDAETYGVSATALIKFSDAGDIKLSSSYYKTKHDAKNVVDFTFPGFEPSGGRFETTDPESNVNVKYTKLDATINYDFEWAELTTVSAYMKYDSDSLSDSTGSFGAIADQFTGSAPGTNIVPSITDFGSEKYLQEVRLASPSNETFEWLVGLFYVNEDTYNSQTAIAEPTGFNLFDVAFPSEYTEKAAFANATVYITPDFDVSAGIRYSDNELTLDADFTGLFTGDPAPYTDTIKDKVTTYLFNARYRINDDTNLYGRVASGYRPAFVNIPVLNPFTGDLINDPVTDADLLWSYEIGAKGNFPNLRMRYDIALWKIDWNEFQAFVVANGVSTTTNSAAGISAKGFEGTFQFYPTDNLTVEAGVTYTDSILDADDPELGGTEGEATRNLPKWTTSFKADYAFDLGGWEASAGAGMRYTGAFNSDFINGLTPNFPAPSNILVDLSFGFTKDSYTVSLYATNLFDEYAVLGGGVGTGVFGPKTRVGIARPRTIGASVAVRF